MFKVLCGLAEDIWITDDQGSHSFHIKTLLVNEEALESLEACFSSLIEEKEFRIVAHHKVDLFLQEAIGRDQLLFSRDYVTLHLHGQKCLGQPVPLDPRVAGFQLRDNFWLSSFSDYRIKNLL